jgi:hypothetical protein
MNPVSTIRSTWTAAAGALGVAPIAALGCATPVSASADETFRSFRVAVPEGDLIDLRRRIAATRWPTK